MADAPAAAPEPIRLGKHEGRAVLATRITPKTGANVMEPAMELDPVVYKTGDRVGLYIEGEIVDLHFPIVKGTDGVARVHILKVDKGIPVDPAEMAAQFEAMEKRTAERAAAAQLQAEKDAGIDRFPDVD